MSDPLLRGAVLHCRGRYGVVWAVAGDTVQLLPVLRAASWAMAGDVVLELAELLACGVPIADAIIRPRPGAPVPLAGYAMVGTVPGGAMCRVVQGMVRIAAEAAHVEKYRGMGRYRERCVDLARTGPRSPAAERVAFRVRSEAAHAG